jgi:mannose-6-phosphate isomerase
MRGVTSPLKCLPNRVWRSYLGGRLIDELRGEPNPRDGSYPEEWVASVTPAMNGPGHPPDEGLSRVIWGDQTVALLELIRRFPEEMLGERHLRRFGETTALLVKLLDSAERLQIQAHPDKSFARRYLSSDYGKTESWIILRVREGMPEPPYILLGFKPGVTEEEFRDAVIRQDVRAMEDCLHKFPVQPGDVYLVESGVPHAIGPGVFMVEVQEPTDFVVLAERRGTGGVELDEEVCSMGLGMETALKVFRYEGLQDEEVKERYKLAPTVMDEESGGKVVRLIDEGRARCFSAESFEVEDKLTLERESFYAEVVVEGEGVIKGGFGSLPVKRGDCIFIPASLGEHEYEGRMKLIACYPPTGDNDAS